MSEREAWLWLANAWDEARPDEDGDYFAVECERSGPSLGLCASILGIEENELISKEVAKEMEYKVAIVPNRRPKRGEADRRYKWPLTREGAAARAAFCRARAAELDDTNNRKDQHHD